jgi:hypothetical protein
MKTVGLRLCDPVSGMVIELPPAPDRFGAVEKIHATNADFYKQHGIEAELIYGDDVPDEGAPK